ncbi:MAG: hypothetical protein CMJ18_15210 [Phycisphaeraceae bacterium]|nr:hypothetical protein [Phycisphaeraceae bacterium]
MSIGWSRTRQSPIAIDFGADTIKLLQVTPGDPPQFVAAASIEVPQAARTIMSARAAFASEAIAGAVREHGFRGKRAICSIPAFQTIVQNLQVAHGDPSDLDDRVGEKLGQHIDTDPARLVIRSFPVDTGQEGGGKLEVVCMAAARDAVMNTIQIVRRARLEVVGLHCEPVAIVAAFRHLYRRKDDTALTTAFIDIGAATSKVVITHGSEIVFAKAIHAAGDHFTRHYAKLHDVSFAEARTARISQAAETGTPGETPAPPRQPAGGIREMGARGAGRPTGMAVLAAPSTDAADDEAEGDALECLVDELNLCVRYHRNLFPDRSIDKLVFLGGEARHVTLCQQIAQALQIVAQAGDPLARLIRGREGAKAPDSPGVDLRRAQPGWAVPMGLCLSETNL